MSSRAVGGDTFEGVKVPTDLWLLLLRRHRRRAWRRLGKGTFVNLVVKTFAS